MGGLSGCTVVVGSAVGRAVGWEVSSAVAAGQLSGIAMVEAEAGIILVRAGSATARSIRATARLRDGIKWKDN